MGSRHNLLLGTALSGLGLWSMSGVAFAAPPLFTQGFYAGLSAGGVWGPADQTVTWADIPGFVPAQFLPYSAPITIAAFPKHLGHPQSGFAGGAQAGYNAQVDNFLFGLEVDVLGLSGGQAGNFSTGGNYTSSVTNTTNLYGSSTGIAYSSFETTYSSTSTITSWETSTTSVFQTGTLTTFPTTTVTQGTTSSDTLTTTITSETLIYTTSTTTSFTTTTTGDPTLTTTTGPTTYFSSSTSASTGMFTSSSVTGSVTSVSSTTAHFSVTGSGRASVDWVSTMRTRFGFVADRAFIYGTAGLAVGGVSQSMWTTLNVNGATTTWTGSKSSTRVGYALGAGIEYALTNQWSIRAQYIYYNLGSSSYSAFSPGATSKTFGTARSELGGSLVTFGINYRFGGP